MRHSIPTRGRRIAAAVTLVALTLGATGCSKDSQSLGPAAENGTAAVGQDGGDSGAGAQPAARKLPAPSWARSAAPSAAQVRVGPTNTVAQTTAATLQVFDSATASAPSRTLKASTPKTPIVLLSLGQEGDRLRVLLPVRPNGSQGWVRAKDVTLFRHDYRMVVAIGAHTLTVYRGKAVVMTEKVGLGRSTTPTPGGVFYTKELLKPSNPKGAYGPYAYGLSGYSPVLDEFLGGDGELGIHGTDDPAGLGKDVSHGCIRMSNEAIGKLAGMLPLGVPVQIVA